jgi:hypothetical protein
VRKKRIFLSLLILLSVLGAVAGALAVLLKQEPEFYRREMAVGSSLDDQSRAIDMLVRAGNLQDNVFRSTEWGETFTAEEINAVLRENLTRRNALTTAMFGELQDPRVAIEDDILKLGFRYGTILGTCVISLELRFWLVQNEPNTIAIEIVSLRAGAIPLNKQWPMDYLSDAARSQHAEMTWYRHGGNPVGLCRLFVDRPQRDSRVGGIEVRDGRLTIFGKHVTESASPQ